MASRISLDLVQLHNQRSRSRIEIQEETVSLMMSLFVVSSAICQKQLVSASLFFNCHLRLTQNWTLLFRSIGTDFPVSCVKGQRNLSE